MSPELQVESQMREPDAVYRPPSSTRSLRLHLATIRRIVVQYGFHPTRLFRSLNDQPIFIVGCPRSGTTFIAEALGRIQGYADMGEVNLLKASLPFISSIDQETGSRQAARILNRTQRFSTMAGLRPIEQTPESTFAMLSLHRAYPRAKFIIMIRDGRDVMTSLIERGWLRGGPPGSTVARATGNAVDDAGQPFGSYSRFWVEPERRAEFELTNEAHRAAWAWRRYTECALQTAKELPSDTSMIVRYEQLMQDPLSIAKELERFFNLNQLQLEQLIAAFDSAHTASIGRWETELDQAMVESATSEAGDLLATFGNV